MERILLVEDDQVFVQIVSALLADIGALTCCHSVEQARAVLAHSEFDLILLDLYLPDGNSIDLCREIRAGEHYHHATIAFVSAEEDVEWRLRAYAAGAEDFLIKSMPRAELKLELEALKRFQRNRQSALDKRLAEKKALIDTLSREVDENGKLFSFNRQCLTVNNVNQLGDAVAKSMATWGLDFVLQIDGDGGYRLSSEGGEFSPIENSLFSQLRENSASVQSFGQKSYFHFNRVELIVQNMPVDDDYLYGKLKDSLHTMASIIDHKYDSIQIISHLAASLDEAIAHLQGDDSAAAIASLCDMQAALSQIKSSPDTADDDDVVFF